MIIKIKEKDPDKLIRVLKAHWDEKSQTNIGNVVDFVDELMKQSGFATFFYHLDFWAPISIIRRKEYETEDESDDFITELDIEEKVDEHLTGIEGKATDYNTWFGGFNQKTELIQYLNSRYAHYMNLSIKKLNLPTPSKDELEKTNIEEKISDSDTEADSCFICGISDDEELLLPAKKRGKNLWICSKCLPKTTY